MGAFVQGQIMSGLLIWCRVKDGKVIVSSGSDPAPASAHFYYLLKREKNKSGGTPVCRKL